MWWDSTEITLFDSVLFSLLTMLILYLVGSGFLRLISTVTKRVDAFHSFDLFQKINFRIIFGFIFIFLLVLFFSFFNVSFLASTLLIIAIAMVGFASARPNFKLKFPKKFRLKNYSFFILVVVVLLAVVFFSSMLINGFYGSTNDDGADHTLMTRIILDNPHALITRSGQPYVSFRLTYPSSTHVLCAFFVTVLGVPIQKIVIMMSVILPCLIALSFYSTLKCLFENKLLSILALIISAFFTIGFSLVPIFWGGLPLLLSLYLSISSMGLIFVFLLKKKMTYVHALFIGLVLFISSQTYPIALFIVSLWFVLILSVKLLSKLRNDNGWTVSHHLFFDRKKIGILIAFLIPILFTIPYFYHIYSYSFVNAQFSSVDATSTLSTEVVKTQIGFNWLFDIPALSHYFSSLGALLALAPYSLLLLIVLCIPAVSQRISSIFPSKEFVRSLFLIYFFMLLILCYLTLSLYLPINFLSAIFNPERVLQHIFIPVIILTAVVMFLAIFFSFLAFKRVFQSDKGKGKLTKNRILACLLLILLIFNFALLSVPIINEQQGAFKKVRSSFATYETLGNDDVLLMNWVSANIPSNADILVSAGDSGQFVAAVTQRQTISRYSYLQNYSYLMTLLTANSSDLTAIPIMMQYNVSYVYLGSTATTYALNLPYYRQFNVTQFLSTPYFTLTKEIGAAWLFQFNQTAALSAIDGAATA